MTADEIDFLTTEELFPSIQQEGSATTDEQMSEDDLIAELTPCVQDDGFQVSHADVKVHSGIETADIYPFKIDRGGETWTLAGVVKGPGSGTLTLKEIAYQIPKPARVDSIDYIVLCYSMQSTPEAIFPKGSRTQQ